MPVRPRDRTRLPTASTGVRARRAERGAVAIEAAIVSVLLFTILAGVVDVSMLFRTTYEVSSASRAGARLAAQEPLAPTFARDAAVQVVSALDGLDFTRVRRIWVYRANPGSPTGEPSSGSTCLSQCVMFTVSSTGVVDAGTGSWTARNACAGDPVGGADPVDAVGVRVQYQHKAAVLFADGQLVQETTTMRLEQLPTAVVCRST